MWILLLVLGCAPKTAPATSATPPPDVEQQALLDLARALEAEPDSDVHALAAALAVELSRSEADPAIRARALPLFDAIEARKAPEVVDAPAPDDDPFHAELLDPGGVRAEARATLRVIDGRIERAREALRRGDYGAAVDTLAPFEDGPGWEDAVPYWDEAVDGFVAAERERAGELFLEARSLSGRSRHARLLEVRDLLEHLIETYPRSAYVEPLQDNLERVERALESGAD